MASYYKRKNGTYCVRVSNGMKNGKQELISATYKPPIDITASAEKQERSSNLLTSLKPPCITACISPE